MIDPAATGLLIACAAGCLSGRSFYSCSFDVRHRREGLKYPLVHDEAARLNFVNAAGLIAHYDHGTGESSWPIPRGRYHP